MILSREISMSADLNKFVLDEVKCGDFRIPPNDPITTRDLDGAVREAKGVKRRQQDVAGNRTPHARRSSRGKVARGVGKSTM